MSHSDLPDTKKISTVQIKISVLLVLGLLHVLVTLFFTVPGYLLIDEIVYHWASRDFAQTHGFEILNGYTEFPSPEMHHHFTSPYNGRLVSQYPYLFTIISYPFYRIAGYHGLFLVNSLAFVGVVLLCYATARKCFEDTDLSLNACLILVLGTFAWEYSQSAWPHSTSALFIMAAFYLFVRSYYDKEESKSLLWALGAGLVAGFAPSIRMEATLLYPALILPFLFARPWRPTEALAVVAGVLPGLTTLALVNYVKFGVLSPFSYGGPVTLSPYLVAALLGLLLVVWVLTRRTYEPFSHANRKILYLAAGAVVVALIVVPQTRSFLANVLYNAWVSVIDISYLDPGLVRPSMSRTPGGGVIYIGAHKKALLQSMPFLAVLLIPLVRIVKGHHDYPPLVVLFLMPVTTVGYYGYAFYHSGAFEGGLCLNYRYGIPVLPFLAILCAYSVREMRRRWGEPLSFRVSAGICFVTASIFFILVRQVPTGLTDLEFPLLVAPLIMSGTLFAILGLGEIVSAGQVGLLRVPIWAAFVIALAWSTLVAFFYDYPNHRSQRVRNYEMGEAIRRVVAPGSIFFTAPVIDPFMRLIENRGVRIAFPLRDKFRDFPELVERNLKAGRRVYGAFYDGRWKQLKEGPLAQYAVIPRFAPYPGYWVGEIVLPDRKSRSGT